MKLSPLYLALFFSSTLLPSFVVNAQETKLMRYLGLVKWFNHEKGYGIIGTLEDGDVFLHHSNLEHKPPEKFKECC